MPVLEDEKGLPAPANAWSVSRLTRRKLKSIAFYVAAWAVFTTLFVLWRFLGNFGIDLDLIFALGTQFALLMGIAQGFYEIVVLQDQKSGRTLAFNLLFRSIVMVLLITASAACVAFSWYWAGSPDLEHFPWYLLRRADVQAFLFFAFVASHMVTFVRTVHKKFGTRVLVNALLGKTQDPTEEERIFMFIDLRSATRLAEELGNVAYSSFLRDYFRLLSNCCAENRGEVYQFAGDGVYLTWPMSQCRRTPHPVLCFHDLVVCFRRTRKYFEREYGAYPEFKAALHSGRVIATEVGNYGSEMAYHGDPINTTARLQSLCNLLKRDLLITETLLRKFPHTAGFKVEEHGGFQLKGKLHELEVYSIDVDTKAPPIV